ncbi:MAG: TMEM175 family protein, partial [Chloroflexota bacterium]|nr:TMEM175 family protein [Chloroflexota bacterium]
LRPPEVDHGLSRGLLQQWPAYAAYATSFGTIGIIWVNHHSLFAQVRHVDRPLLFLNLLLLMCVSVIPFPTALLGRYLGSAEDSHVAAAVYGGVMVLMSVCFTVLWRHVTTSPRLIRTQLDPRRARRESLLFSAGLLAYSVGIAVAFISAPLSLLLYALIAIYYVFPWLPER